MIGREPMATIAHTSTLVVTDCCVCGCLFGLPEQMNQEAIRTGRSFFCPNGHSQSYTRTTKAELEEAKAKLGRMKKSLALAERLEQEAREQQRAAERKAAAARGQVTKLKRKVAAGRCPCCTGLFPDLQQHMSSQHPDFVSEEETQESDHEAD